MIGRIEHGGLAGKPLKIAPVVPVVPIMPAAITPATIAPAAIAPAGMPVAPAPPWMPVMPVAPPHGLSIRSGGALLVDFGGGTLTKLFLNLLHTNLELLTTGRLGRTGIGGGIGA